MVTLSLMILLTVVAVGLLGLSAVSLRSSGMHEAQAQARANARLALMLAIGELQKTAGKDTTVTAPSDLTLPVGSGQRQLTGVWDSWPVPVSGSPDYPGEKDRRFRGWLVSDADRAKVESKDYPQSDPTNPVVLYQQDPSSSSGRVAAGLVKAGTTGDYAWHVADESTKARIDQLRNPDHGFTQNRTRYQRRSLQAGHRTGLRKLQAVAGYDFNKLPNDNAGGSPGDLTTYVNALPVMGKLASLGQVDLLEPGKIPPALRHELTVGTLGVLSDVAAGGLKKDLSTAFGVAGGLPPELAGRRVYQSTHGTTGISDPHWSNLSSYHNLYTRKTNTLTGNSGQFPSPVFASTGARDGTSTSPPPVPKEYQLAPVIQRVDLNFSVFTRSPNPGANPRQYNLYMTCNPVVILHNPYSSDVTFERFTVVIEEPPLLFEFKGPNLGHFPSSPGTWQPSLPKSPLSLGQACGVNTRSAIRLELPGRTRQEGITLGAGNTMYVGAEILSSKKTIQNGHLNEALGSFDNHVKTSLADSTNSDSEPIPCFNSPKHPRSGVICRHLHGLAGNGVAAFRPAPDSGNETFTVKVTAAGAADWKIAGFVKIRKPGGGTEVVPVGTMRFDFGNAAALQDLLGGVGEIVTPPISAGSLYTGSITADNEYAPLPYTFATLSLMARTAHGGVDWVGVRRAADTAATSKFPDGRLAGKPFLHENASFASFTYAPATEKTGMLSHEMSIVRRPGNLEDAYEVDGQGFVPALTGGRTTTGIKVGLLFDLGLGPMLNLAGFRRSNVFASAYLPRSVQPFANSWVPPIMNTDAAVTSGVAAYDLLDHSYLANAALYDGYYFSTVAGRPADSKTARDVFKKFATNPELVPAPSFQDLLPNQTFRAYSPGLALPNVGMQRLFKGDGTPKPETWQEMASWQLVKGPFNVNSTSLTAWKAMLASMANTVVDIRRANGGSDQVDTTNLDGSPVTALSMHHAGVANPDEPVNVALGLNQLTQHWNGFRTLRPAELDELAGKIVEEVRTRGPFLSMAEFVNRRLGSNSELTRVGALQAAINKSKINDGMFPDIPAVTTADLPAAVYGYKTPESATGNPADGAPGILTQGDLLNLLEPRATVRGDTFVIRTVGRALDKAGKVTATAYAEAVVQRLPDYVDPADQAHVTPPSSPANKGFGRRIAITGFRWLSPSEIQ